MFNVKIVEEYPIDHDYPDENKSYTAEVNYQSKTGNSFKRIFVDFWEIKCPQGESGLITVGVELKENTELNCFSREERLNLLSKIATELTKLSEKKLSIGDNFRKIADDANKEDHVKAQLENIYSAAEDAAKKGMYFMNWDEEIFPSNKEELQRQNLTVYCSDFQQKIKW